MLGGSLREVGIGTAVRRVFAVQGSAQWFVALPVAVGGVLATDSWLVVVGVVVWAVGFAFETVGDRQLAAYKATPKDQRPAGDGDRAVGAGPATPTTSATPACGGACG